MCRIFYFALTVVRIWKAGEDMNEEKIVKGLECLARKQEPMANPCSKCDYHDRPNFAFCVVDVATDALALLKEQEARVMTLDEVKAFDWDYCYLEEERLPGKEYRAVCGDYALTCITWPCVASMRIQHGDNSYEKKWRCWTRKPSKEQRKAVKWDA